jgi:hypothetical protein
MAHDRDSLVFPIFVWRLNAERVASRERSGRLAQFALESR